MNGEKKNSQKTLIITSAFFDSATLLDWVQNVSGGPVINFRAFLDSEVQNEWGEKKTCKTWLIIRVFLIREPCWMGWKMLQEDCG